jgi:hypothetical protein
MADEQTTSSVALAMKYGKYWNRILAEHIQHLPKDPNAKKGSPARFVVTKPLPTKEEFERMCRAHYTTSVDGLVSDAFAEFESLADELQSWYDNLPEPFQQGEKGDELQSAINTLQNLVAPDVPEEVANIPVVYMPEVGELSRATRCAEAAGMLNGAIEAVDHALSDIEEEEEDRKSEWESFMDDLRSVAEEAEGVEFPGAFGN